MRGIFFLIFSCFIFFLPDQSCVSCLNIRYGIGHFRVPYASRNHFNKYYSKNEKVRFPVNFQAWRRKIPTFIDDTYSCRASLGLSYFMLKGDLPIQKFKYPNDPTATSPPINRFYKWYKSKEFAYVPTYVDYCFRYRFRGYNMKDQTNYIGYIEIKFHGMTIVDGLTLSGGNLEDFWHNIRLGTSWVQTALRYSVNYTSDFNEWTAYRNKDGDIQQFLLLESTPKDGVAVPGYTRFQPRIVARAIRFIHIAYRTQAHHGPGGTLEVFGCSYDGENAGLQTPNKRGYYKFTKETVLPWQLYGAGLARKAVPPEQQAAMVLSRYYVGKEKGTMPHRFGHCQMSPSESARLILVQKGKYTFRYGSPLRYFRSNISPFISKCVSDDSVRLDPAKSLICFNTTSGYKVAWRYSYFAKRKMFNRRRYKTRYIKGRNELDTSVGKYPKTNAVWCAQQIIPTKFYFTPHRIKRTTDCNDMLLAFGDTYCKNAVKKYWELDLKKISLIDSLKFKGHPNALRKSYASHVIVLYSVDRLSWLPIRSRYLEEWYFPTNTGPRHTSHHPLNPRVRARFLRITPHKGKNDICIRVEVRGCAKEPWLEAQRKVKDDAKKMGFNMWHTIVAKWNKGKRLRVWCFHDDAKTKGKETLYEVYGDYEFPLGKNWVRLKQESGAKFYKCVARDEKDCVISTQLYIITAEGHPGLLLPIQEQGLLHQGGMPILDHYGTIWAYEPVAAKITFLFFPDKTYAYEFYGLFDFNPLDLFYLTRLGPARNKRECFWKALHNNQRYFVLEKRQCYSSWALPYFVEARGERPYRDTYRYRVYIIHHYRKPYEVLWKKESEDLGTYHIEKEAELDNIVVKLMPYSAGKMRFRFDSYITTQGYDSHSLIIKDFTTDEVKDFSINIYEKDAPKRAFNRSVMLRHFGEPRFNMSATGGACQNHPLTITAVPLRGEYVESEEWEVEWRKLENGKYLKTKMETDNPFVLKTARATPGHSGVYRIRAKNRYGFAEGVIRVDVVQRLPSITSVTSSPHVAVEDTSDVLHVDVANEEDLLSIDWYYNGKLIEIEDKHFSFPGSLPGRPDSRKILKMSNMHLGMSGVYKVVTRAKFCEFVKEILVDVYVRPKMIVIPNVRTMYQIAGGNTTVVKVIIAGGVPMPQREHLVWYKDSKPLQVTRNGRVKIQNDEWLEKKVESKTDLIQRQPKRIGWNSTLSITSPRVSDSGKYFFMVSFPKTNYTVERIIKVTKL